MGQEIDLMANYPRAKSTRGLCQLTQTLLSSASIHLMYQGEQFNGPL
jgi:hypothetical protein